MTAAYKKVVPEAVSSLRRRIEEWRQNRSKRRAMPAELWRDAVELARQYGVHPMSRNLTISYTALKKKVAGQVGAARKDGVAPAFMEIQSVSLAKRAVASVPEIEVLRPDGYRLVIKNTGDVDVSRLMDAFCGSGR